MQERLEEIKQNTLSQLATASDLEQVKELRVKVLGKKGEITQVLRGMGSLSAEERPRVGQLANRLRQEVEAAIETKEKELEKQAMQQRLQEEKVDVTLPGVPRPLGAIHPLTAVIEQVEDIFIGMGFAVAEGPEVEQDYYNFEALNVPKDHPARDMQDTFYLTEDLLLRTQTSPVQIRTMRKKEGHVPIRIICPGTVYRRDDDDATHSHQFMQIEGLVVDRGVSMTELKGTLLAFVKQMFGEEQSIRLRPSYFPFTEPSVEVDIRCMKCNGGGCRICKETGWIEILGAGMVHPHVLRSSGYDEKRYTGFAFGIGVERVAMLKYGVDDIRHFYTNDLQFLRQFRSV
ncbi:phenylalanine--tRNA ligase subunit alpha [Mechercharimyces sp. CAU 1602]|uniref:phenylalanine--tRNA ligase subunit alpha n=1 Tax=Mechercharimyces sp. CAU 1602 TaxID=2973933 RepID=UPI0021613729|nr:phenylalanine--tRNA ligase subunit alpha [Mechercharimyces sp. CAU 1602]MCS1351554.1 phenylalanine--tRNA ligase subunit alpha [Mechercharimyces sp. CAU 1602]